MTILTIGLPISQCLPLNLKPHNKYYQKSKFCIVYKYISVSGVILNLYILASSLIPCDVIPKWGYCTSTYNRGIPHLHIFTTVVKTSQIIQVQKKSGSRVPLGNLNFTPYLYSQGGGILFKKYNHNTLRLRESVNSIPPTFRKITVRCFHKTLLHTYSLLTLRIIHTY